MSDHDPGELRDLLRGVNPPPDFRAENVWRNIRGHRRRAKWRRVSIVAAGVAAATLMLLLSRRPSGAINPPLDEPVATAEVRRMEAEVLNRLSQLPDLERERAALQLHTIEQVLEDLRTAARHAQAKRELIRDQYRFAIEAKTDVLRDAAAQLAVQGQHP
jgi:hypothetical protein